MTGPVVSFNIGLKVARENTYSVAPNASTNGGYWQGGRWIDVSANQLPSLQDQQATIFPSGHAGRRAMNNRVPVVGRKWSGGGFPFDFTADVVPLMLIGALGSVSSNMVPSTDYALLAASEITQGGQTMALTTQPSDGGAILFFHIENASANGVISLSGIDAAGNGASELITFSSAGSLYSRTSFSSLGNFSVSATQNGASVTVYGIKYFEHTITANNTSSPSFSIEALGDPTAGAASIARLHTGMVVRSVTLNSPAEQRDGVFTGNVEFEGNPTATCTATSLNSVSPIKIWPAWGQAITKNGNNWYKATNFSLTVTGGNRNYRAAAGAQNPQGAFYGGQEVTGSFEILVDTEEEYNEWRGASGITLVSTWTSPWLMNTGQYQQFIASMVAYLDDPSRGEAEQAITYSSDFRTVEDANLGIVKFYVINNIPSSAYS